MLHLAIASHLPTHPSTYLPTYPSTIYPPHVPSPHANLTYSLTHPSTYLNCRTCCRALKRWPTSSSTMTSAWTRSRCWLCGTMCRTGWRGRAGSSRGGNKGGRGGGRGRVGGKSKQKPSSTGLCTTKCPWTVKLHPPTFSPTHPTLSPLPPPRLSLCRSVHHSVRCLRAWTLKPLSSPHPAPLPPRLPLAGLCPTPCLGSPAPSSPPTCPSPPLPFPPHPLPLLPPASSPCRSVHHTVRCRLSRARALSKLGIVDGASRLLLDLIAGVGLPDPALDSDLVLRWVVWEVWKVQKVWMCERVRCGAARPCPGQRYCAQVGIGGM